MLIYIEQVTQILFKHYVSSNDILKRIMLSLTAAPIPRPVLLSASMHPPVLVQVSVPAPVSVAVPALVSSPTYVLASVLTAIQHLY